MQLARERAQDAGAVEALFDTCFAPGRTSLSSYRLRDGVPPAADLCLVMCNEDRVAGAVRFWPVRVADRWPAMLLGPVAVHPVHQGEGLGAALIRGGVDRARAAGVARIVLVGDLPYYARFGFARLDDVAMPPPTNPDRVLGCGDWDGVAGAVGRALPGAAGGGT